MRRRNATTEFLKECMADALLKLLKKKPMDAITVSEITEEADVGRVTFYRHFKAKEDLLYFKCQLIGDRWYGSMTPEQIADPAYLTRSFFRLMDSIREMLTTLYRANLHHIVLLAIHRSMGERKEGSGDSQYTAAFLSFGIFGILTEWINGGCQKSPEELAELALRHIRP